MNTTKVKLEEIKNDKLLIDKTHVKPFTDWRQDKTLFVETGTNYGNGIFTAFECGFEKAISVEIDSKLFFANQFKYAKYDNVKLFLGDSQHIFPLMLELVDEPAFFWIDAHHDNGDPAFHELKYLKDHHIKTHTILVDDMPCHFEGTLGKKIEDLILEINPDYTLKYLDAQEPTPGLANAGKNYILVAYV